MDETRIIAHLPNLEIQLVHRQDPPNGAETVGIQLRATPSFEALGRGFAPFVAPAAALWMAPVQTWAVLTQQMWAPWLALMAPARRPPPTGR